MRVALLILAACVCLDDAAAQSVQNRRQLTTADELFAEARDGSLLCTRPNISEKRCSALIRYSFENEKISSVNTVVFGGEPLAIMQMSSPVYLRDGVVCRPFTQAIVNETSFIVGGTEASPELTTKMRSYLVQSYAVRLGQELCDVRELVDGVLVMTAVIDGVRRPDLSTAAIWVRPEDGFSVLR